VQVQVLHELDVVHEHLLADVALEGHVRLEFRLQELRLPLQKAVLPTFADFLSARKIQVYGQPSVKSTFFAYCHWVGAQNKFVTDCITKKRSLPVLFVTVR